VALQEHGVHARGDGCPGEQRRALGAAAGGLAGAGGLRRVRAVEAQRRGPAAGVELDEVAHAQEVVDEAAVAKEGAAFGDHDVGAAGLAELFEGALHFAGRKELALLDVDGALVPGRGLARGGEQVGLTAEERGDLQEVEGLRDGLALVGLVDVGGCGAGELLLDL
jgi:hypothetical protein